MQRHPSSADRRGDREPRVPAARFLRVGDREFFVEGEEIGVVAGRSASGLDNRARAAEHVFRILVDSEERRKRCRRGRASYATACDPAGHTGRKRRAARYALRAGSLWQR